MILSDDARKLIKLSLKGLGLEPALDTGEGMGFELAYANGAVRVLIFRVERSTPLKVFVRDQLRMVLYEERAGLPPLVHLVDRMRLPTSPSDMPFLMAFTSKVVAMVRAVETVTGSGGFLAET